MEKKLTVKQRKFCQYYAQSGNATESAIKAGYSTKTAYSIGQENLNKPELQNYLKKLSETDKEKRIMGIKERQEWLTKIIYREIKEKDVIITEDGKAIEIEKPAKMDTILKASEQLNKMQGAYLDRLEVRDNRENSKLDKILEQLNGEE